MLLGCRAGEIGGMRWSELDLAAGTWCLPKERSKNHREHKITLPSPALEIIRAVPRQHGRDHLFGARGTNGFTGWCHTKRALDRRLGDRVQPWRVHDIRRTVATGMADIGIAPHIIEAVLNHHSGHRRGVAGTYNRSDYGREVTAALARWADHVLALVEGRAHGDRVVPLRA